MHDFKLLINGKLVAGAATLPVIDPATESVIVAAPRASREQLESAVAAAKAAQLRWGATSLEARREVLRRIADAMQANFEPLAKLLTQEQGKPLPEAMGEVMGALEFFRYFSTLSLDPEVLEDSATRRIEGHRRPLGVVAAIIPWNFPLVLLATKVPAALLAGNSIIIKPAPTTPLTALEFGRIVADLVPPGVINVTTDNNDLGDVLASHPDVRKISFTGSTSTGKKIMASAATSLKRLTLELGGNDAAIVLDDVDPKVTAPEIYRFAFMNSGQICVAIKRLYVHESIYDAMCDELSQLARAAVVGNGMTPGTQIGPMQNRSQFERIKAFIDEARTHGVIAAGGEVLDGRGFFIRPTIVRDIAEDTRLVSEEQFGPVLPVLKYTDIEDAIARANATPYGLGASVWSTNLDRAHRIAVRLEAGNVWVNKHFDLTPDVPSGGAKNSGMGVEFGVSGLHEFTQLVVVNVPRDANAATAAAGRQQWQGSALSKDNVVSANARQS